MVITDGRVAFLMEDSAEIRDEIGLLDIDVIEEMDGDDTLTGGLGRQNSRTKRTTVMRKNKETGKLLEHQNSTIRLGGHNEGSHEVSSFRLYSATHNRNFFLRFHDSSSRRPCVSFILRAMELPPVDLSKLGFRRPCLTLAVCVIRFLCAVVSVRCFCPLVPGCPAFPTDSALPFLNAPPPT